MQLLDGGEGGRRGAPLASRRNATPKAPRGPPFLINLAVDLLDGQSSVAVFIRISAIVEVMVIIGGIQKG